MPIRSDDEEARPRGRVFDIVQVRKDVVAHLRTLRFEPRDADGTDFQHGDDTSLRFKVGTVKGEVTVMPMSNGRAHKRPMRILSQNQVAEYLVQITHIVENHLIDEGSGVTTDPVRVSKAPRLTTEHHKRY